MLIIKEDSVKNNMQESGTAREIWDYREMIASLVRKDLRGRYKGSVLGFLWTFINPLFQLVIYTIVFSTILKSNVDKYYLFLFVALIPWLFFSNSLTGGASCVLNQKEMVKKIYFPREVLPIANVTGSFVNMLLCFIIIFIVVFIAQVRVSFSALLCLPIVMVVEYILALGIAFLASAVTVYFRDFEHILGIVNQAWIYLTPVMYSIDIVPKNFVPVFYANPMTSVIEAYRDILYYGRTPQLQTLGIALGWGCLILFLGVALFRRLKKHFAEEL